MSRINIGKVAPIPKGDWVQSEPYEKLNMVNKSGVLYIAKQDVPVNTAITNIDYWMPASGQLSIGTVETVSASTGASATITDGSNGPELNLSIPRGVTGNESIDDTKGKGDTDYVWSADKNYEEITNKAPVILNSASGSIASFADGSPAPVTAMSVSIDPVQDLHGYDNPWPARGGVNKLDYDILLTWKQNNNNIFSLSGNDLSVLLNDTTSVASETRFLSLSAGTYTMSADNKARMQISWDGTKQVDTYNTKSISFTLPEDRNDIHIKFSADSYPYNLGKVQITAGTTIPSWTPYSNICPISGHTECNIYHEAEYDPTADPTVTIDLDGTIYGGTLDVLTGKMTVDRAIVDLGTLNWGTYNQTYKVWDSSGISSIVKSPSTAGTLAEIVSDRYPNRTWNALFDNRSDPNFIGMTIGSVSSTTNTGKIRVQNGSEVNTPTGQLVYKLKSPFTIQLTPSQMQTLLGENHIWSDTGDTEVTYRADTKLYIQKLTQPTEDDMIANNNIEVNKFFMLGNSLYYSTTAIAVGTSIIPGNNCTKLSLADALNNLNS